MSELDGDRNSGYSSGVAETDENISSSVHGVPRRSWFGWWQAADRDPVILVLGLKALIFAFAVVSLPTLFDLWIPWSEMWNRWDAVHYQSLAQHGYQATGEARFSIVFYPLYPWLVRLTAFVIKDYVIAAVVVSGAASIAIAVLLRRLTELDHSPAAARLAVWFLLIFPTSYFLHIGYTESLFLALVLGCVLAARSEHWALAGILGACACLTRVNGLILGPTLVMEAWLQYRASRRINWRWLWIGVVGFGFLGYLILNYKVTGNFFAFSGILEEQWYKKFAPPWVGIRDVWERVPGSNLTEGFQEFFFIAASFLCMVWSWFRLRASYSVWITLNFLLMNSTSFVVSVPRYCITLFPMFILLGLLATKRPLIGMLLTVWSLFFLAVYVSRFAQGTWAF